MEPINMGKDVLTTVRKVDVNRWRVHAHIYNIDRTPVSGSVDPEKIYLARIGRGYIHVRAARLGNEIMYPVQNQPTEEDDPRLMAAIASGYDPESRQYKF